MIENRDGSFRDIVSADSLIKQLDSLIKQLQEIEAEDKLCEIRAVHFGSKEELQERAKARQPDVDAKISGLQYQLNELTKKVNKTMIHLGIDDKSEVLIVGGEVTP